MGRLLRASFVLFAALLAAAPAWAVFELSVAPRRGGHTLRFDESTPGSILRNEEATVTVSTDLAVPYRIVREMYEPLTNETGDRIPQDAFVMFSPSNPIGHLRAQLETPVGIGQAPLYASNPAGESDSFVLVFNVRVPENQPGGVYRTRIQFTAEPSDASSSAAQSVRTLEVRVEIRPVLGLRVSARGGGRELNLGRWSEDRTEIGETVDLEVSSNVGTTYRIVQEMVEPLRSDQGVTLSEALLYSAPEGPPRPVTAAPAVLFTSDDSGKGTTVRVPYTLAPEAFEKAGSYRGLLQFRIESNSPFAGNQTVQLPVRFEISSVFDLEIDSEAGGIQFGRLKPHESGPQTRRIRLRVRSNLRDPYQVSQILPRRMATDAGDVVPPESLLVQAETTRTGDIQIPVPRPVAEGETVIFVSDPAGTPEEIDVLYTLNLPENAKPGSYNAQIKFSITSL